jgi:hypothetical protein
MGSGLPVVLNYILYPARLRGCYRLRVSRHSKVSPDAETIADPTNRLIVGTSPQMRNPRMSAHNREK